MFANVFSFTTHGQGLPGVVIAVLKATDFASDPDMKSGNIFCTERTTPNTHACAKYPRAKCDNDAYKK